MSISLRPLHRQVIVITGATSGIGLSTIRMAVEQGAKVFMIARQEDELQKIQDDMRANAYDTAYTVADESDVEQLQYAADRCIATFGRIDTWINNADISVYGEVKDTTEEEARRLFDTNFWGLVNGCKVAIQYMSEKGGALINVTSSLAHVALPIQSVYSASKLAIKGYTDSLRDELHQERSPIAVTLVTPSAPDRASYSAEVVAKIILKSSTKVTKEVSTHSTSFVVPFFKNLLKRKPSQDVPKIHEKGETENFSVAEKTETPSHPWIKRGLIASGAGILIAKKFRRI